MFDEIIRLANDHPYINELIAWFIIFTPILNTLFAYTIIRDWIITKYMLWLVRRLLRKIAKRTQDKELAQEINEVLNNNKDGKEENQNRPSE